MGVPQLVMITHTMMSMLLMMMLLLLTPMLHQLMMPMVLPLMMLMVLLLMMNMLLMMMKLLLMLMMLLLMMPMEHLLMTAMEHLVITTMMMLLVMTLMLPQEMLLSMKPAERLVVDFHLVDVEDVPDLCPTAEDLLEDLTDAHPDPHREVLHRREDVDVDSSPSLYLTVAPLETGCWPNRLPANREVKQDCQLSVDLGILSLALINHFCHEAV